MSGYIMSLSEKLLKILACPCCHGPLQASDVSLVCAACRLEFPVREGIPVLLVDQARPLGAERAS